MTPELLNLLKKAWGLGWNLRKYSYFLSKSNNPYLSIFTHYEATLQYKYLSPALKPGGSSNFHQLSRCGTSQPLPGPFLLRRDLLVAPGHRVVRGHGAGLLR